MASDEPRQGERPALDYATPKPRKPIDWMSMLVGIVVAIGICVLMTSMLLPSGVHLERANRIKCASNLRQIGQAILLYAKANSGQFPLRLDPLIIDGSLDPEVFTCPSSNAEKSFGKTSQEIIADLGKPAHNSYIYVGGSLTTAKLTADTVIAYEYLADHDNEGMNVLYGDGHVDWEVRGRAEYIVSELKAGFNPPRPRSSGGR